jgi:alpha-glucosidase (family GH31 glycosyl hydrolase)
MYSHVVECANGGKPLQRPVEGPYHYLFGDDFFVAPIYQDSLVHTVHLPDGEWRYFFDDEEIIEGPTVFTREFPLDEYPVYVRDGAIVPMRISRSYTGVGEEDWGDYLTLNIYPQGTSTFSVHHPDEQGSTQVRVQEGDTLTIALEGTLVAHLLRVYLENEPGEVLRDEETLKKGVDWEYREGKNRLIVKCAEGSTGAYQIR